MRTLSFHELWTRLLVQLMDEYVHPSLQSQRSEAPTNERTGDDWKRFPGAPNSPRHER